MKHHQKPECPMKKIGLLHSGSRSQWRVKLYVCPADIFYTIKHFVFKLVIVIRHYESECHAKRLICNFKVKVSAWAHLIKIWQFLLYLLNCWSLCYQTWFDSTLSQARVFYGEIGLLCWRSRSQQMSMNICPDDIFRIAEHFTTNLDMVMHHYEPDCLSKILVCCLQGQGHS